MNMENKRFGKKIVIALGGNALQIGNIRSAKEQLQACKHTAQSITELIKQGHLLSIVHGNGPQVGELYENFEFANKINNTHQIFPLDVCDAFTQGYIGYHLQNAIGENLRVNNIAKDVVTIITQVEVSKNDQAFKTPTKPIGTFYQDEEAKKLMSCSNFVMKEDSGRGWRKVVASPKPIDIVEKSIIKNLFEKGTITISCGGGGIPVVREGETLIGVEAVIDKDFAAAKLAAILKADLLIILTAVEKVCLNFNKPNQISLTKMNIDEANVHIDNNQFASGSMLPKIQAAISFIQQNPAGKVLVTSLEKAIDGINGITGTIISYN